MVEFTCETLYAWCLLFVRLVVIDSVSLIDIGLIRVPISLGEFYSLYLSKNLSISPSYQMCEHRVVHSFLSLCFLPGINSDDSFLICYVGNFHFSIFCFCWLVKLGDYQFYWNFLKFSFWFPRFFSIFLFYFHIFIF